MLDKPTLSSTPEPEPLRVAVVGCGNIGSQHAAALASLPGVVLVGATDIDPDRAAAVCRRHGGRAVPDMHALLSLEPQMVAVATPDHFHTEPVCAALEAGCDVFCEKPLASRLEDARRMRDTAMRAGRLLGVDYNRRFGFGYQTLRDWLDGGRIGVVRQCIVRVTDGIPSAYPATPWAICTTLLTHHIDLVRWLVGEIEDVHLRAGAVQEDGRHHQVVMSLGIVGGAVATIAAGLHPGQSRTRETFEVGGTEGMARVEDVVAEAVWWGSNPDRSEVARPDAFHASGNSFPDTIGSHLEAFVRAVRTRAPAPVPAEAGIRGLEVLDAALRSHRDSKTVRV